MVNREEKERTEGNHMCSQTQIHHFTCLVPPHCWFGSAPGRKCLGCLVLGKRRISLKAAAAACPLLFAQECVVVLRPLQPGLQVPEDELL